MENRETDVFDVVVVGGRVAGASTAMLLARAGHRVAVVDRTRFPSDTLSTHHIWHAGIVQLRRWGLLDRLIGTGAPASRQLLSDIDGMAMQAVVPEAGGVDALYAPRRNVLDPLLLRSAEEAGAQFFERITVTGVTRDGQARVNGVVGRDGSGQPFSLRARHVVGADGWRSRIARSVQAPAYDERPSTNACHYAYWEGLDHRGTEMWFRTSGVMAGVFPTHGGACVFVNCRTDRADDLRRDLRAGYLRFLTEAAPDLVERLAGATQTCRVRGTPGQPNFLRKPFGPGWALVGDAGYTKDPVSGHGITDALRDAELLATALDKTLRGRSSESKALASYQEQRDRMSHATYNISCEMAAYQWDPKQLLQLQSDFSRAVIVEANEVAAFQDWAGVPAHADPAHAA